MPENQGIGGSSGSSGNLEINRVLMTPANLNMRRVAAPDLQAEVAKSRILEAVNQHIKELGPEAAGFSFDLSFSLSFGADSASIRG